MSNGSTSRAGFTDAAVCRWWLGALLTSLRSFQVRAECKKLLPPLLFLSCIKTESWERKVKGFLYGFPFVLQDTILSLFLLCLPQLADNHTLSFFGPYPYWKSCLTSKDVLCIGRSTRLAHYPFWSFFFLISQLTLSCLISVSACPLYRFC